MKGFTLIELIIVIVIIGILAAVAIPKYVDLVNQANKAARDGMAGAAMSAVSLYFADSITSDPPRDPPWPATLDATNFETGTTFILDFGGYTWAYSAGDHSILTSP